MVQFPEAFPPSPEGMVSSGPCPLWYGGGAYLPGKGGGGSQGTGTIPSRMGGGLRELGSYLPGRGGGLAGTGIIPSGEGGGGLAGTEPFPSGKEGGAWGNWIIYIVLAW